MYQMSQSYGTTSQCSNSSTYSSPSSFHSSPPHFSSESPLEYIAHSAISYSLFSSTLFPTASPPHSLTAPPYSSKLHPYSHNQTQYIHLNKTHQEYHFNPDNFLKPGKHSIFVGDAEQIRPFVEETFSHLFNTSLPENIKISICNEQEFRTLAPHPSTIGLSINRGQQGLLSEIFLLNNTLPRVLLTLGHELGHVLTQTLSNAHNEEAKAYAFSLAWMNIIKEHNIANLADCIITESPATNGLHDIAFNFISTLLKTGKDAWNIYCELILQKITITQTIPFTS